MEDEGALRQRDQAEALRRPWSAPKVILSDSVSVGVAVDNKGRFNIPDRKSSSTSTS